MLKPQSPLLGGAVIAALSMPQAVLAENDFLLTTPAQARMHFEEVDLPGNEKMGFLGGSLLYDVNSWLSVGPSAYGALTGERGGFITLGVTADARYPISKNLDLSASYFVGGGGGRGGFTLSGGGLMLRSSLGVDWHTDDWGTFGLGVSNVDFPSGTISSTQPYISYSFPFDTMIGDGWKKRQSYNRFGGGGLKPSRQEISVVMRHYQVPDGVLTDGGAPQHKTVDLLGAEWLRYLDDNRFLRLEAEGAMGGKSTGYMQILVGGGYRHMLSDSTALKASVSAGVAGGGAVATGGGFLLDGQLSLQQDLSKNLFVELGAGYAMAPDGDFEAVSLAGKLGYRFGTPDARGKRVSMSKLGGYQSSNFRFRVANQSYLSADPQWRSHHADENIDNIGVHLDYFLNDKLYVTGQGVAAYTGNASAYMAGLVGGGVHHKLFNSPFYVDAEVLIGAAGGGGVRVGGGLVWQANAGVGYEFTDSLSVSLGYGHMAAMEGPFAADVANLTLAYKFNLPTR